MEWKFCCKICVESMMKESVSNSLCFRTCFFLFLESSILIDAIRLPSQTRDRCSVAFRNFVLRLRIVAVSLVFCLVHGSETVTAFFLHRRRGTNSSYGLDRWVFLAPDFMVAGKEAPSVREIDWIGRIVHNRMQSTTSIHKS